MGPELAISEVAGRPIEVCLAGAQRTRFAHVEFFASWPQAAVEACLLFRRCQGISRHAAVIRKSPDPEPTYLFETKWLSVMLRSMRWCYVLSCW